MINIIDLFSGCGGLTEGFLQTKNFKTLAAVDWELQTVRTLKSRLSNKWGYQSLDNKILHFDIQRTDELINGFDDPVFGKSKGLDQLVGENKVDIIIGGPPCQAYSIAGRVRDKNGMKDDYRNFLFESYVKIVKKYEPKYFVFENVEGMLSAKPGGIPIVNRIRKSFQKIGYDLSDDLRKDALFDISFYKVPQRRKRVIIFGVRKDKKSKQTVQNFYKILNSFKSEKPKTLKGVFRKLPKFYPLKTPSYRVSHETKSKTKIKNHQPRFHNDRDIRIFRLLSNDILNGEEKYTSSKSLIEVYKKFTGRESKFHKYNVLREDKPSNTIPAHLYKDGLRHIHPDPLQARSITVREAARIQSFDDDFEFLGSRGDQYKMIGNAVPPAFSKKIAEVILNLYNE